MWLVYLEAALALGLAVFIVWWTMFQGGARDAAGRHVSQAAGPEPAERGAAQERAAGPAGRNEPGSGS